VTDSVSQARAEGRCRLLLHSCACGSDRCAQLVHVAGDAACARCTMEAGSAHEVTLGCPTGSTSAQTGCEALVRKAGEAVQRRCCFKRTGERDGDAYLPNGTSERKCGGRLAVCEAGRRDGGAGDGGLQRQLRARHGRAAAHGHDGGGGGGRGAAEHVLHGGPCRRRRRAAARWRLLSGPLCGLLSGLLSGPPRGPPRGAPPPQGCGGGGAARRERARLEGGPLGGTLGRQE